MNNAAIHIENLVKYYDGRQVLDHINLKIPEGSIYGLLGRNGAGKTTLIRILLGLEPLTRGSVKLLGTESHKLTAAERGHIGYVAEGHNLIQHYKVARLIELCKGLATNWDEKFFAHLLDTFRLPMDRKIKELSTGMRAQLNLALAMAINPKLLILDDPSLGLDTVARRQFLELAIEVIQQNGRTILFSSHILSDVERIADRIGIIVAGQLVVDCPLEELKHRVTKLRVMFQADAPAQLHMTEIIRQENRGREMVITLANDCDQKRRVLETYQPEAIDEIPMSLEDIFIECTDPTPPNLTLEPQTEPNHVDIS